jgi:hypothetical protein
VRCFRPPQQFRRKHGMAVAKDIRPNVHRLADDAFDWKTSCVDERITVLDVDTTAGTATDGRNPLFRYCGEMM